MKNALLYGLTTGLALAMLGLFVLGCEDQSENIPVQWDEISGLMATGWAQYAAGDYLDAEASFEAAGQRSAQYLPAYNGLGWCAVRLTHFDDAEEQFSFITTLADPVAEVGLLADAYAGLSLSATIERSYLEITEGGGDQETLSALAQQSIDRANMVFDLVGENYNPADHDTAFGSNGLHLLCAQNYFYLQEYENSEAQLSIVDPGFVPALLEQFGQEITATLTLNREISEADTTWYLLAVDELGEITDPGVHHYTQIIPLDTLIVPPDTLLVPDTLFEFSAEVDYNWSAQNRILISPAEGSQGEIGKPFEVSYVYLVDFVSYLYALIEHIEELIEF